MPIIRRKGTNIKAVHSTFTAIYVILAAFILSAPVWFINYELIFESGLLGFTVGIAFLLVSITIVGKELCHTRGEFVILGRHVILINFAAFASMVYIGLWYLWNTINTLRQCSEIQVNMTDPFVSALRVASATVHTTSLSEDQDFQALRVAKICRNEQGFGIFLLVLLVIIMVINLVTIIVYSWLWRKIRALSPV